MYWPSQVPEPKSAWACEPAPIAVMYVLDDDETGSWSTRARQMLSAGATGQAPSPGAPVAAADEVVALGVGDADGDGDAVIDASGAAGRLVGADVAGCEDAAGVEPCGPVSRLATPPPTTTTAARPRTGVLG